MRGVTSPSNADAGAPLDEPGKQPEPAAPPPEGAGESAESGGTPPVPCDGPTWGLALSGGGVRAALFSLGVLVALVETGVNQCVRCIASVSGGSILNAAVAQGDFTTYQTVEKPPKEENAATSFWPTAQRLATSLSTTGLLAFNRQNMMQWAIVGGRVLGPLAFIGLVFGSQLFIDEEEGRWAWPEAFDAVPWPWVAAALVVLVIGAVLLTRGQTQRAQYAALIRGSLVGATPKLDEIKPEHLSHVFVATELLSGQPAYFSKGFIYCEPYGWSETGKFDLPKAVYASAAFPIAFPPLRYRRKKLAFQNGGATPPYPKRLKFVDGGVYNNLGDDWFDALQREQQSPMWRYGELGLELPSVARRIVVNASAPSKAARRTFGFGTVTRIMSVLYDNTVGPRVEQRKHEQRSDCSVAVLDIGESPHELAERLLGRERPCDGDDGPPAPPGAAEPAAPDELLRRLGARDHVFWLDFTRHTARTKTKLSKAGVDTGARLMLHGYLSCLVLLNLQFGVDPPDEIRGEKYFLSLAGRGG